MVRYGPLIRKDPGEEFFNNNSSSEWLRTNPAPDKSVSIRTVEPLEYAKTANNKTEFK